MKSAPDKAFAEELIVQSHPNPLARRIALILVLGFAALIGIGTLLCLPAAGAQHPLTWRRHASPPPAPSRSRGWV
jgi:hypothetical protein